RKPQLVLKTRASYLVKPSGTTRSTNPSSEVASVIPIERTAEDPRLPVGARWVCKGPGTPIDFVVVREGFVSQCPKSERAGDETNAWFIRKTASTEVMCRGYFSWHGQVVTAAPVPSDYVVTGETVSADCGKSGVAELPNNAWTIRKPVGAETVCKGFPLPRGFVMVKEVLSTQCP